MNAHSLRTRVLLLPFLCACALPAAAQDVEDDPVETARVQLGPLGLTPSIALANLGIDSNVFNDVEAPRQDFTFTVSPHVDVFFRAGPSLLSVNARADLVYFHEYSSERSLDGQADGRWEVRWNRVRPWIAGGYSMGRQRVGYEIDLRSRRIIRDAAAGIDLRIASKTHVGVIAQRTTYEYDADALFLGTVLADVLNRRTEAAGVQYRQALTPLSTFVVHGEALRDTFATASSRDAESVRVTAGFDFDEHALVSGQGRVGYRRFVSTGGGLPGFEGVVASYGVAATIKGRTRLEVSGERDVNYSYELSYPYYVLSGATLTLTPRLTERWDIQGRAGAQWLAYRTAEGVVDAMADRTDRHTLLGAGIGLHLGRDVRIGFNADHQRRTSAISSRDYEGFRFGTSVTYGR